MLCLRRADPERRVRTALLLVLIGEQLLAHFVQRHVPRMLLPLAADELHRVLQPVRVVRHAVLADRGALRAVRAQIDRRVEHRLLPDPHAVLHHGVDRAADGAVRADRALDFDLAVAPRPAPASALSTMLNGSCDATAPAPSAMPERRRNVRRSMVLPSMPETGRVSRLCVAPSLVRLVDFLVSNMGGLPQILVVL